MRFVLVDAIFVDGSARTLFNDVLEGLEEDDFESGEANGDHCEFEELANVGDDFGRFQQRLSALSSTMTANGKSSGIIVVVVENAGFLCKFPPAFLTAVLRLPDQVRAGAERLAFESFELVSNTLLIATVTGGLLISFGSLFY
jgi:hypothetical protein